VAIQPFACQKKRFAQNVYRWTDGQTPRECISSWNELKMAIRVNQVHYFLVTQKPTQNYILLYNNNGLISKGSGDIATKSNEN